MSGPATDSHQPSIESNVSEKFVCYCGDWRFRNAHFVVDEIREKVCRDLPFYGELEGKQYCVLHYPHVSKACDFKPVFDARVDEKTWDFRMVYFPEPFRYEKKEFTADADFGHAIFAKGLELKYCKLRARLVFFDAHFLKDSYFTYSEFFAQANFNAAEFQDHGGFAGVKFHAESRPLFEGTQFKSGSFGSAEFYPVVEFNRSIFSERADFFDAKFFSKADFEGMALPQNKKTEFRQATFYQSSNFAGVEFYETDFTRVKFAASTDPLTKQTTFKKCKFNKSVSFVHAEFHSPVDFSNSLFQNVHFESATFHNQANFLECSFLEDVFFNDTAFGFRGEHRTTSSHVIFDGATFGKDSRVFFDNTWFSWHTTFDYAKFDGYVFFKGNESNPVFDPIFERHAFWSLLKILNATFDRPEKAYFEAIRLRPSWFVNVTAEIRKFNFTNIEWTDERRRFITVKGELAVVEKLNKHNSKQLLAIVFRQLADNAEANSRFEDASLFRRLSMEAEWLEKKSRMVRMIGNIDVAADRLKARFGKRIGTGRDDEDEASDEAADIVAVVRKGNGFFVHLLYRITSYYGESWTRALIVLALIVLVIFPFFYTYAEFELCPKEKPLPISLAPCESNDPMIKGNCQCVKGRLMFGEGVAHSLTTATLQNVDYRRPTTKKGETLIILEKIFAPLQAALLALALRRKFMR
jgi:uncharacterized protein YjbI with pentapeptide repeats